MTLGEALRAIRRERGLRVTQVVESLGVPRSTAYSWEGPTASPQPSELQALLDLYGATDDERLRIWSLRARPVAPPRETA